MGTIAQRSALLALCAAAAGFLSPPAAACADGPPAVIAARPGDGAPLSLRDCAERAVARNDAVHAERLRRRELDGQMTQALATGLPSLDASGVWTRGRDPSFALDSTFGGSGDDPDPNATPTFLDTLFAGFDFIPAPEDIPAQTYWRTSLNLSWTINPVRVLAAVGAAEEAIHSQDLAIEDAVYQAELEAVTAYHGIVLAAGQVEAVEARLANQREFLDIMRLSRDLEVVTSLDTLQAAVAVANLEPQLRLARRGLRTAGATLNAAMGADPAEPVSIAVEQTIELDAIAADRAVDLGDQRPDLRQLDLLVELLEQTRRNATADMRPFLAVNGSYGLVGRQVDELTDKGHDFWSASVVLNIPLFNGRLTKGRVDETRAAMLRTRAQREGLGRQVRVHVLDLLEGLDAARQNLQAAHLNVSRATELLETSKFMLRLGEVEYLTVLESEAGRAQAQTNLIQARHDVLTATASLKRAIGISPMRPLASVPGLTAGEAE